MVILHEGALIGGYRVRSLIFRASLFDVYSAIDDRGVAVCALRSEHGGRSIPADSEFKAELEKLRALRADRFPRVLAGGRDDRAAWLITEAIGGTAPIWTPGADPIHWLRAFMTLGHSNAAAFVKAAKEGIYHGALTPDCLRKWPNGSACIVGIGAARLFGIDVDTIRASPRYCAPEQFQEGAVPTDERTDVYSLGMCLHALMTGREPFDGAAGPELISLAQYGSPDFSLLRETPDKVREVLAQCCAKSTIDRYDWARFADGVGITTTFCISEVPEAVRTEILTDKINELSPSSIQTLIARYSGRGCEDEEAESSGDPASADTSTDRTPPAGNVAGPLVVSLAAPVLISSAPSNEARGPTTERVPAHPIARPPKKASGDVPREAPDDPPPPVETPAAPPRKARDSRARTLGALAVLGGICVALAVVMMSNTRPPVSSAPPRRAALFPVPQDDPVPLPIGKRAARALSIEAADALTADDWSKAEALLRAAWEFDKTYDIAGNLGHAQVFLGKPCEGARYLQASLNLLPPSESQEKLEAVASRLMEARAACEAASGGQPREEEPVAEPSAASSDVTEAKAKGGETRPNSAEPLRPAVRPAPALNREADRGTRKGWCGTWFNCEPI